MKNKMLLLVFMLISQISISQNKNFNIIMVLNDKLLVNIENIKIRDEHENTFQSVGYVPGNLSLDEQMYSEIVRSGEKYFLTFMVVEDYKKDIRNSYEIQLENALFEHNDSMSFFCVIEIFNLNIKKYKKRYKPLSKDRNYSYNLLFPSYSIIKGLK